MRTRWKSFCGHKPRRAWRNFSGLMHRLWIGLGARLPSAGCCTRAGPSTFSMAPSWKSGATRLKAHGSTMMGIWRSLGRCFGRGPFILDQQLDGAKEPGEHLPSFLAEHSHRWKGEKSYLYLDSGCSAANYVNATDAAGFSAWSISYNKLTDKLEQLARQLPESAWRCWSGSGADGLIEQYAWPVASARGLCPGACVCGGAAQAVRGVVLQVWVCDVRTCGASQSGGGCLNGTRSRVPRNSVSANCSVIWTCSIRPVWN